MDFSGMLGGGLDPSQLAGALGDVLQGQGGVNGLIDRLRSNGLGGAVDSWVSTGANEPVDPQRLGAALGPDAVQQLSGKTGLSIEMLLPLLASILPMVIDFLTPGGQLPKEGEAGGMGGIGDLLGSVLGGGAGGAGGTGGLGGLGDLLGGKPDDR